MIMNQTMQYNHSKIARWIIQCLLADVDQMKFAFVARKKPDTIEPHVILQTFTRNTKDLALDQEVQIKQFWGYFRFFVDEIYERAEETGDYMVYKVPSSSQFKLYKITQVEDMEEQDDN
jgi:translation initiation factor 3 subunit D